MCDSTGLDAWEKDPKGNSGIRPPLNRGRIGTTLGDRQQWRHVTRFILRRNITARSEDFGRKWLGRNGVPANAAPPEVPGITPERFFALTESARRYGFHGTLKPPFEMNPRSSREALFEAVRLFAKSAAPIELPPLELAIIGKFIALNACALVCHSGKFSSPLRAHVRRLSYAGLERANGALPS